VKMDPSWAARTKRAALVRMQAYLRNTDGLPLGELIRNSLHYRPGMLEGQRRASWMQTTSSPEGVCAPAADPSFAAHWDLVHAMSKLCEGGDGVFCPS